MEDEFEGFEQLPKEILEFVKYHGQQLIANSFPLKKELIEKLYLKLMNDTYDSGQICVLLPKVCRRLIFQGNMCGYWRIEMMTAIDLRQ